MGPTIVVTEKAMQFIKQRIEKEAGHAFRLSVKKTGCSGYAYAPSIIKTILDDDIVIQINELKIYVDPKCLPFFEKITIDFQEDSQLGIKQKKLIFVNPNESSRCGCGESFHIEPA